MSEESTMVTEAPNQNKPRRRRRRKGGPGRQNGYVQSVTLRPGDIPEEASFSEEITAFEKSISRGAGKKKYNKIKESENIAENLRSMKSQELNEYAAKEDLSLEDSTRLSRPQLIFQLLKSRANLEDYIFIEGTLETAPDGHPWEGHGFLRAPEYSYLASSDDIWVSNSLIEKHGLQTGHIIRGAVRSPSENERFLTLLNVDSINERPANKVQNIPSFESLTPLHPEERVVLETTPETLETRVIDLVSPLGYGQRALIVAPPRTGKTVLLQRMTSAIASNNPDTKVIVLLVDERPEEVTDFRRNTPKHVEVVASTFDEEARRHIQVAEMVMNKARRMVEFGDNVVVLLDSITRLARGYNNGMPNTGKIGTGGVDSQALIKPKKFFGSARNIEDGGSLTIIGTALVDTGSKADEVIFEEFKGTGNSELHLTRKLVEKRIYPAIDIAASGTRREELLLDPKEMELVTKLRKVVSDMSVIEAMELLRGKLSKSKSNAEFLMTMSLN